ncbi:MAG: biopolymer transporter ExbD [Mariniblastus sp.]|nr:biopolymer transporter ExbD [Mariniblastus sp.]
MKAPRYKPAKKYGFNMTPMIDVVFLLIIFFLVSSHLARQENQIEMELPVAQSADDDVEQDTPRVTVNVKEDGTIWVGGRPVSAEALIQRLTAARQQQGDDLEVRIRGSRVAPYAFFEPIMLACTESGIWNVTFAVYREEVR